MRRSAARGQAHPLGEPEEFESFYLADGRAHELRPGTQQKFRGVLRRYIARTRREDAKLKFPCREVELFPVEPGRSELKLEKLIGSMIADPSGLEQSNILPALSRSGAPATGTSAPGRRRCPTR